jgi:hypothetical protein
MTPEGWPETEQEVRQIVSTRQFKGDALLLISAVGLPGETDRCEMIETETAGEWARRIKETLAARYGPEMYSAMLEKYGRANL